jgi:hypothetical protein
MQILPTASPWNSNNTPKNALADMHPVPLKGQSHTTMNIPSSIAYFQQLYRLLPLHPELFNEAYPRMNLPLSASRLHKCHFLNGVSHICVKKWADGLRR